MPVSRTPRASCCCLAVAVLGAACAAARAGGPAVVIMWSLDGVPAATALPDGVPSEDGYVYEGEIVDPATGLVLAYDLLANYETYLGGNLAITNQLSRPIQVLVETAMFVDAPQPLGSLLAGTALVALTTGADGGALVSVPPHAVWKTRVDGQDAGSQASLFADPFALSITGPGSAAVWDDFGLDEPVVGPPIMYRLGYQVRFGLTTGDHASITSGLQVVGGFCEADLDGDGEVGVEDLVMLLAAWGPAPGDPADLDGDGEIAIADLLELLALWGPCG